MLKYAEVTIERRVITMRRALSTNPKNGSIELAFYQTREHEITLSTAPLFNIITTMFREPSFLVISGYAPDRYERIGSVADLGRRLARLRRSDVSCAVGDDPQVHPAQYQVLAGDLMYIRLERVHVFDACVEGAIFSRSEWDVDVVDDWGIACSVDPMSSCTAVTTDVSCGFALEIRFGQKHGAPSAPFAAFVKRVAQQLAQEYGISDVTYDS